MSTITASQVMRATSWADLNLPHDASGLKSAQRAVHPDICSEPSAHDAFTKLPILFHAPDMDLRLAKGKFMGGSVEWKFDIQDQDLTSHAESMQRSVHNQPDGALWAPSGSVMSSTLTNTYGNGWWFLRDFKKLDARTVVWVAKRLMAAISVAEKAGIVHGDINENTVALNPSQHGLMLDGWWTAVEVGETLQVRPDAPTLNKYLNGAAVDSKFSVSQASKLLLKHECGNLESHIKAMWVNPTTPQKAFRIVDEKSREAFGKPTWHELAEPKTKGI